MHHDNRNLSLSKPRWDGRRVLFDIAVLGERVPCAISQGALQTINGRRHFKPIELLRHFMQSREQIEALATTIFQLRPTNVTGIVSIWEDDVDDPPSAPAGICHVVCGVG